jgi:eukaryotic-like serine/threonine-protein kinase
VKTELGLGETTHDSDHATDQTLASSASSAPLVGASTGAAGDPKRGDSIGRFVVLGVLGSGGMGVVYSAFDPHLDRKVAIKLLAANARTEGAKIRMLREAQAMAKINHPNVIRVHEVGTYEDQIYLAIEFADAGTVRGWLKDKPSQREILDVFAQAGRGLGAAHALGLVHRDFKPDNVLMSKTGAVQVTDFGLVSVANAVTRPPSELPTDTPISQELTQTGSIMGTPTYMSPEQFKGEPATARTDQFSFCVALYEALYRMRPFAGATYAELLVSVTSGALLPAPPDVNVRAWMRRVLLRGLSIDPDKRYASMDELLAALARDPARRRNRGLALAGVGLLAASGVAFALFGHHSEQCGSGDDRIRRSARSLWACSRRRIGPARPRPSRA